MTATNICYNFVGFRCSPLNDCFMTVDIKCTKLHHSATASEMDFSW